MADHGVPVKVDDEWNLGIPYANVAGEWKALNFAYVNVNGVWKQSWANFNQATGGTVTDVDNYNGTGEKWRVHEFTSNGTFDVKVAANPFRILLFGGGGSRGSGNQGGGGAGGHIEDDAYSITPGSYSISIGKHGNYPSYGQGGNGGNTTAFGLTALGGGGGGYFRGGGGTAGSSGGCGGGGGGGGRKGGAGPGGGGGGGSQGGHGGSGGTDPGTAGNSSSAPGGGGGGAGGPAKSDGNTYSYGQTVPGPAKDFDITGTKVSKGKGGGTYGGSWNGSDGGVVIAYRIG